MKFMAIKSYRLHEMPLLSHLVFMKTPVAYLNPDVT